MLVNLSKDKVFQNDNNAELAKQDHCTEEELVETSHESPSSSLPTLFSLAADTQKKVKEKTPETFEEMIAHCRAQMDKPLLDRYPPIAYAVKIGRYDVVKFLIDEGESVNEPTPDIPVWYSGNAVGMQQGYTPLEIAISQQDVEMVKILTTYSAENRATPEISYQRYMNLRAQKDHYNTNKQQPREAPSSPLLDALKTGNQEIIDLVLKAYTDPTRLYAERTSIKNPAAMHSWIEQNVLLWKGEKVEVSDAVASLFLNKQGLNCTPSEVESLLQHGWIVTKQELEQALKTNDPQTVRLLITHTRTEESPISLLVRHNRADLVAYLIETGEVPTRQHLNDAITHGSLDIVRTLIEHGVPSDGAFQLAVEHKQWRVAGYLGSNFDEVVAVCLSQKDKPLPDTCPPVVLAVRMGRLDVVQFLIDKGESVHTSSPDIRVVRAGRVETTRGFSPLEIAIKQNDAAMARLLVAHGATAEMSYYRSSDLPFDEYSKYYTSVPSGYLVSSPLLDALKLNNQEMIDLVIKAYRDPMRLYGELETVRKSQQAEAMRSWIEQNVFLWKGERVEVSDEVVKLLLQPSFLSIYPRVTSIFMTQQGVHRSPSDVEKLLTAGVV
ncbi:MAG: ankyrin repeat domain-containing protein, partial [Verrucomicrobia bacterium]|nr:ankyrin repeat domain-containing protein [Verrucomicrobiota bacterium]